MKKEVVAIRKTLAPFQTGRITERLKDDGYISEFRVRFYPGVELALEVSPFVLHKNNRREDLVTYPFDTKPVIVGDNDYLIFPCTVDFVYDDEICVEFVNNSSLHAYTLSVDIVVVYHREEVPVNVQR